MQKKMPDAYMQSGIHDEAFCFRLLADSTYGALINARAAIDARIGIHRAYIRNGKSFLRASVHAYTASNAFISINGNCHFLNPLSKKMQKRPPRPFNGHSVHQRKTTARCRYQNVTLPLAARSLFAACRENRPIGKNGMRPDEMRRWSASQYLLEAEVPERTDFPPSMS